MQTARLTFYSFCGMSSPILDSRDNAEVERARTLAARIIRSRRKVGHHVTVYDKGARWEVAEPEGCAMVPDTAGTLSLSVECRCDDCGRSCEDGNSLCERCDEYRAEWEDNSNLEDETEEV